MTLQRTPALAYNSSGYDNHLMLPKIGGKFKECKVHLFCSEKGLKKKKYNGKTFL